MELYKIGSRGEMVRQIQKSLAGVGLAVIADGIFGSITAEAVKAFQNENGMVSDGIVGPATLARLLPMRFKRSRRHITDIVIHCTGSQEGVPMSVEQIRNEHKLKGWSDIGYHYVVCLDGSVHTGRDVDLIGAHVSGHNAHSIGVVYVGGLSSTFLKPKDTRTLTQKAALLSLLMDLRKLYPEARIRGHRDFSPDKNGNGVVEPSEWIKNCPCFDAATEYRKI